MYFVYSIQSEIFPERYYVGMTTDVIQRLNEHNTGKSIHTNKFKPWKLLTYVAFSDKGKAGKFETYLKTGSGRAFCKRHF
ncbi:MAG: excinuclease ABC subunit C [Caedibacter sp. 38-128]|nr:GIY-YIG nuclease family protein [Holosporales bacterium]OJX04742.1 MAG: excinuclease ABC subunit C [Caedibacter sp. 38-128]